MPMMPTFEVTAEQKARLLAPYGSEEAYLDWLRYVIKTHVLEVEMIAFDRVQITREAKEAALDSELSEITKKKVP